MIDATSTLIDTWRTDNDDVEADGEQWTVVVRPSEASDEDPRAVAEQLFAGLHGHGRLSFEIHSNGPEIELAIVAPARGTAETVARHVRSELGAQTEIREARLPIEAGDPLAAAEFEIEKDVVYPLETIRTSESECSQLHHLLDTFAAESVRSVYQVVVEPADGDWTARRSRAFPESVPQEQDPVEELKRAGVAMVPVVALSVLLSPWPFETALIIGCALIMAATVGEGVSIPERRTGGEIARAHRERVKEHHGARSSTAKRAEKTADEIIAQAGHSGWRASIRLIVADDTPMLSEDVRDTLVAEIESSFSSSVTGQTLSSQLSSGSDARDILDDVRTRRLGRPDHSEGLARLLGKGTRRELHVGPGELGVLGYFPGKDGGGSEAREFVGVDKSGADVPIPDTAPRPSQSIDADDHVAELYDDLSWHIEPDTIVEKRHPEHGKIKVLEIEDVPGDEDDIAVYSEFVHQLVTEDDDYMLFGFAEQAETIRFMGIPSDDLTESMLVVGVPGTGKSTFAVNEAVQHAYAGRGCMVIDPHEQLVNDIQQRIPEHRQSDVIRIDPADIESAFTHSVNMLEIDTEPGDPGHQEDVDGAVDAVVGMLFQGASSPGDRMRAILEGVVHGTIIASRSYTFVGLRRILREEEEQEKFYQQMVDDGHKHLAEFAEDLIELSQDAMYPIIRQLDRWVRIQTTRELVKYKDNTLTWDDLVRGNPIILVNTNISNDNIQVMFSTYFLNWCDRACRRRPEDEQTSFPIIIDEVDDIISDEMDLGETLVNGRKYGVGLTLITQHPSRLQPIKAEIENDCKTVVSFKIKGKKDKKTMADLMECDTKKIMKIGKFRAQVQMEFGGETQGPFQVDMLGPAPPTMTKAERDRLSIESKRAYGCKRAELTGVNTLRGETEPDGGQEETPSTPVEEFLHLAAEGVEDGTLVSLDQGGEDDAHYKFVHKDTPRERLRINLSRVIETFEENNRESSVSLDAVRDFAREAVDDENAPVTGYRQYTPDVGRCIGVDLNRVNGVDPGDF